MSAPTKGQRAYEARMAGCSWPEAAKQCGSRSGPGAMGIARSHARTFGLAWPIAVVSRRETDRAYSKQAAAYELAAGGWAWDEISSMLDYSGHAPAIRAARKYADREGMPWPIKRGGQ